VRHTDTQTHRNTRTRSRTNPGGVEAAGAVDDSDLDGRWQQGPKLGAHAVGKAWCKTLRKNENTGETGLVYVSTHRLGHHS
jgi:hypothetical protein